jgi:uncharacterized protein (TIGR03067 family)
LTGTLRIVPKIDLTGFEHKLMDRTIRLCDGVVEELTASPEGGRLRPQPASEPTSTATQEAIRSDQQRLQGVWKMMFGAVGGRRSGADARVRWTVTGDQVVMEMNDRWVGKCVLDPTRSPKRISLVAASTDGTREEIRGIYEIRGDRLCVCLAFGDEPRPDNLRSSRGTRQVSLALQRSR